MNQQKQKLMDAMVKIRFSPVEDSTFSIYEEYESLLEPDYTDDICTLCFYRGESYFRIGKFTEAITDLMKCIRENKNPRLLWFTACSYNILGLIYSFLGNEFLSMKNYQHCLSISKKEHLFHMITVSYLNIGGLYRDLNDDGKAMEFYKMAEASAGKDSSSPYNLEVLCLAYQGHIYCRQNKFHLADAIYRRIETLTAQDKNFYYSPSLYCFYIRLFYHLKDTRAFTENLNALLDMAASRQDFLEFLEFYYDICAYLICIRHQEEAYRLLNCMEKSAASTDLVAVQYRIAQLKVSYSKHFLTEMEYISSCEAFINLEEQFIQYTNHMKRMHIHNVEELEQIKMDTRLLREKSQIDQLTGLFNKHTIEYKVKEYLETMDLGKSSALLLIDMDNFKHLNDILGHLTGDKVLKDISALITECFSENALCGRIGGDEFLVYFKQCNAQSTLAAQVENFKNLMKGLTYGSEKNYRIHASMGAAFTTKETCNYPALFVCADGALYTSKQQGKNQLSFGNTI
ncbi:MAG: GGDEF domain-containing protein [Lachnospiraceae bacterium]|nr:GGDEF domain-containing protein [Lachnospiraceae bacterium]